MKGIELPINALVIVAIAVIVLLGIVALYFIGWNPFSGGVSLMSLKNTGCSNFSINFDCGSRGATPSDIILPPNSFNLTSRSNAANKSLQALCENYFNISLNDGAACRALCNCV